MDANEVGGFAIVETHVVPAVGCITCSILTLAPMRAVLQARHRGSLGELNPLPWAAMFYMGFIYVVFALLTSDWYVFISSSICMCISVRPAKRSK